MASCSWSVCLLQFFGNIQIPDREAELTQRHNVIPIEVKSNREYSAVSLGKFRRKFADALHTPVVLHPKDLKTEDGIRYLPIYMTPLLAEIPT